MTCVLSRATLTLLFTVGGLLMQHQVSGSCVFAPVYQARLLSSATCLREPGVEMPVVIAAALVAAMPSRTF